MCGKSHSKLRAHVTNSNFVSPQFRNKIYCLEIADENGNFKEKTNKYASN